MVSNENEIIVIKYDEVLEQISNHENHLLVANGFNNGLGIRTGYVDIFNNMIENNSEIYKDAEELFNKCGNDIEKFIGELTSDIADENVFLKKYVKNKVKLDFMESTQNIVTSSIKEIYSKKNEGIYMLLKNFTNYFTLNFDSFMYILLLKYKKPEFYDEALVLTPTIKFKQEDLDRNNNEIYTTIKQARKTGQFNVSVNDSTVTKDLSSVKKSTFYTEIKEWSDAIGKNWKKKEIERVIGFIMEEEKENACLSKVDDGSEQLSFFGNVEHVFDTASHTQNLFFLHGAFHIYKDGKEVKKITQKTDKALYSRIEEVLNTDGQDIVCIFQHEEKLKTIKESKYLSNCLNKLGKLAGNLVIIGCSFGDNDKHIFEQIRDSNVETIYISEYNLATNELKRIKELFPNKIVQFFDAKTISYEIV